ncbi:MAG: hypothetical protein WDM76_04855 [Limisphaerales bacterium]
MESDALLSKLSKPEAELLHKCEAEIDEGLDRFITVGYRLHTIKSRVLYRATHNSFEKYCKEKWGFTAVHAKRLINANETNELLKSEPIGSVVMPQSEAAVRAMTGLTKEEKGKP